MVFRRLSTGAAKSNRPFATERALFEFLRKQLIETIEWLEQPGQLAWRVPFHDQEIMNGAQLTVREGQVAAFVNEGQLADYFGPGLHRLDTANLPLLTDLMHWGTGFKSPFKSDVVFFSLKEQVGRTWGTAQPVTVRDAEFGPIRLRAFGSFSFSITELDPFLRRLLGTLSGLTVGALEPQLRAAIQTALATALGGSGIAFLDLAANQQALSERIKAEVDKAFATWGLGCATFFVESISLPDVVQAHLDKGSSMRVVGDLDRYTRFQSAEAIEAAAHQEGGLGALGAGVASAAALGNAMSQGLGQTATQVDPFEQIERLHKLLTIGALTQAEFDAKKAELLARVK
jgi:membrane protease subunit (stomatin/prohibitin family)